MNNAPPKTLFRFITHFIKPYRKSFIALFGFAILAGFYGTINAYLVKLLIDDVANLTPSVSNSISLFHITLLPAILLIVNYEVHNLSWRGINFINLKIAPIIRKHVVEEMFSYSHRHSFRFFQDNFSGTLASNINKMSEAVEEIVHHISVFVLRGTTQLILALIAMYLVHPIFFAALLIWAICFFILSFSFSKRIRVLSDSYAKSLTQLSGKVNDSISNVSNVRLFAREDFETQYLEKSLNKVVDRYRSKEWYSIKLWWSQGFSITLLIATMVFSLIYLRTRDLVTIGDFALILSLVIFVTDNIWWLTEQIDRLNNFIGIGNQSLQMISLPHEIMDHPEAKPLKVTEGKITFNDVSFKYKVDDNLFENKSVTIPGGQKVGLVGFSGSGKTTFVNLIVRLFDLSSGEINIDGQNIAAVTQTSLREKIGFIPQDPVLFHRTLMENIRYGKPEATDDEVIAAAKKAHAHEFILLTPKGYDSLVGERGIKLSGGQRQRIAIARAILKNAPILILDEATSALDSVTEGYIQESLSELMQGKTVIVIAHRLSTLLHMDRILVFDKGRIVEDGKHAELLVTNGMYAVLWNSQVGGFLLDNNRDQVI